MASGLSQSGRFEPSVSFLSEIASCFCCCFFIQASRDSARFWRFSSANFFCIALVWSSIDCVPWASVLVAFQFSPIEPAFLPRFSTPFSMSILSAKLFIFAARSSSFFMNDESLILATLSLVQLEILVPLSLAQSATLVPVSLTNLPGVDSAIAVAVFFTNCPGLLLASAVPAFLALSATKSLALLIAPFSACHTPSTSRPLTPPKPSLRNSLSAKFFTLPLIFAAILPSIALARFIRPFRMPLLLPNRPFMNLGPNCIARLISPEAASLASLII